MDFNKQNDRLLEILTAIESDIAKIYKRFSTKKSFPEPARKFWRSISSEEDLHAEYFNFYPKFCIKAC